MKGTVSDPSWSSNRYTDWNLHVFGLSLGARTLPSAPIAGLKSLVLPVEYIRCVETRYILQHLDVQPGQRVLDIGSPKLLSLFLAARLQAEVHATDLVDYFFERYDRYSHVALGSDQRRYVMRREDARHLTYPSGHFDRVFSIRAVRPASRSRGVITAIWRSSSSAETPTRTGLRATGSGSSSSALTIERHWRGGSFAGAGSHWGT